MISRKNNAVCSLINVCLGLYVIVYSLSVTPHGNTVHVPNGGLLNGNGNATTTPTKSAKPPSPVRVLCWILTHPRSFHATLTRDTWIKTCDVWLFFSEVADPSFPVIGLNVSHGVSHQAAKSRLAWEYVYERHLASADYFLKADPDSYILIHNLKAYLSHRNPMVPEAFGLALTREPGRGYAHGGPGVVLSHRGLTQLVTMGLQQHPTCFPDGTGEDYKLGACLRAAGVPLMDTLDQHGRLTFLAFPPAYHLTGQGGSYTRWYELMRHRNHTGNDCCSVGPVAFHHIFPDELTIYHYLLNVVRVHNPRHDFTFSGLPVDFGPTPPD